VLRCRRSAELVQVQKQRCIVGPDIEVLKRVLRRETEMQR
jgi:hypothetical protein